MNQLDSRESAELVLAVSSSESTITTKIAAGPATAHMFTPLAQIESLGRANIYLVPLRP